MSLPNHHIDLTLNTGADESQDGDFTAAPIDTITDFEYRKDGKLTKRRGWNKVGDVEAGMGAASLLATDSAVAVLSRNALIGTSSTAVDAEASARLRNAARVGVRRLAILSDTNNLIDCDVAVRGDGFICVAATRYDGTDYSVRIAMYDANGVLRYEGTTADAANPRIVARASTAFDVYYRKVSNHTISVDHISGDPSAGGAVTSTTGLVTLHATYVAFDVITGPLGVAYLAYNSAAGHLTIDRSAAGATIALTYDTTITTADYPSLAVAVAQGNLACVYATKGSTGAKQIAVDLGLTTTLFGPTTIHSGATIVRTAVADLPGDANNGTFALLQREATVFGLTKTTSTAYLRGAHTGLVNTDQFQHVFTSRPLALASSGFDSTYDASRPFAAMLTAYSALNQLAEIPTLMLGMFGAPSANDFASSTAPAFETLGYYPAASLLTDQAAYLTDGSYPSTIASDGNGKWYLGALHIVNQQDGTQHTNVSLLVLDTDPPPEPLAVMGRTVYAGGGLVRFWDGYEFGEVTPPWAPFVPVVNTVGSGGNPAAGDYSYVLTAEWVDANGEVHRSPVSEVGGLTGHTGGSVSVTLRLHTPTALIHRAVLPKAQPGNWTIKVWRTQKSPGAIYYLTGQKVVANNDDSSYTFTDTNSDLTIGAHETLYTTGAVLEAQLPPAFASLVVHRNRLWGLDAVDPRNLWPSNPKEEAISPEWNHDLVQRIEQGSTPVCLASLDDKLIIFTGTEALAIVGDGPGGTGVASGAEAWAEAEVVAPGVGASGPHAALTTPLGIIVHGPSGFKLLGRDMSATDIGGALLATAPGTATIRRSIHVIARQQAWFLLTGGAIVVFDYSRGKLRWYKFTSQDTTSISDIAYVGGSVYLLGVRTGGGSRLYIMDPAATSKDDEGVFVPASLRTGWIRPDGLLGEMRFRVVHGYGKANSGSGLSLLVEVQGGEPHSDQTFTWTYAELATRSPAHPRERLHDQRGQGARVTFTQVAGDNVDSDGFEPAGVGFDYGGHGKTGMTPGVGKPG